MLSYSLIYEHFVGIEQPMLASESEVLSLNCFFVKFYLFFSLTDVWEVLRAPDTVTGALTVLKQLKIVRIVHNAPEHGCVIAVPPLRSHIYYGWNMAAYTMEAVRQEDCLGSKIHSFSVAANENIQPDHC